MKRMLSTLCLIWTTCCVSMVASAAPNMVIVPTAPPINAEAHILVDFHSGRVLSEQNGYKHLEPASLTKMMTMYVVDAEMAAGRLSEDEEVTVSEKAWRAEGSRMFIEVDTRVKVGDLIRGVIVQSGNDASIALAEYIAGGEEAFVAMMNQHAQILGMENTNFVNATGIPDPNQYTTAYDLTLLSRALIRDFPESYAAYSEKWFTYNGIKQPNRNRLLWRNDAVDGIKTGHAEDAGFCIAASAQKDGMRLLSVILGAQDDNSRMEQSNKLLTYGFRFFETHRLFEARQPLKETRLWMGEQKSLPVGTTDDVYVTIPQGQYDRLQATLRLDKKITAPVQEDASLGSLVISLGNEILVDQPLISLQSVPQGGLFSRFGDYLAITFSGATSEEVL